MNKNSVYYELQQFMRKKDSEDPLNEDCEAALSAIPSGSNQSSHDEILHYHELHQDEWENKAQTSSAKSNQATTSHGSSSGRVHDSSYTEEQNSIHHNENEKQKFTSTETPKVTKQEKVMAPYKHHSFLSDVSDVRNMEQELLQVLEDSRSGNLRAFGKGCSMEQMNKIREQQEKLARLHFELGQHQDGSESNFRQSNANVQNLLQRLEQLSLCIEQLHSN